MPAMDYGRVAKYYDLYARTDMDVPFFLEAASGCEQVLELTAGTGRLSIPLLEAGVKLTCLDSSPEMLAILRKKLEERGLSAPVYEMDASSFTLPAKYDLILIPFNSFAEITERKAQEATLSRVNAHLADDGKFICTFHNPRVRLMAVDGQVHLRGEYMLPGKEGTLRLSSREEYHPEAQMVSGEQIYEIRGVGGETVSTWSVRIKFSLHSKESFEAMARSEGFEVERLYGDYSKGEYREEDSPFMIWVLRR